MNENADETLKPCCGRCDEWMVFDTISKNYGSCRVGAGGGAMHIAHPACENYRRTKDEGEEKCPCILDATKYCATFNKMERLIEKVASLKEKIRRLEQYIASYDMEPHIAKLKGALAEEGGGDGHKTT